MRKQIRRNVFETNSSSMHSLVITKDDNFASQEDLKRGLYINEDGVWNIWCKDDLCFGRSPFRCLSTFSAKVRYTIASLCGWNTNAAEEFEKIKQIVSEIIPECTDIKLPQKDYYNEEIYYGGVDENILGGFLEENNISIKDFLLNNKYKVIVDGDEYCVFSDLRNSGLINKEFIVSEYPKRKWLYENEDEMWSI